jgi:hypothetical protein
LLDDFEFSGVSDAVRPEGFGAICKKAINFINAHFECDATFDASEFERAYALWINLAKALPIENYGFAKRHLVTVAVLIQAVSTCRIARYQMKLQGSSWD